MLIVILQKIQYLVGFSTKQTIKLGFKSNLTNPSFGGVRLASSSQITWGSFRRKLVINPVLFNLTILAVQNEAQQF